MTNGKKDTGTAVGALRVSALEPLKKALSAESVQKQFRNALAKNSGAFVASIIDLVGSDKVLQQCDPNAVIMECLKAATLKLPINKQLGFAWIIPYKKNNVSIPQFQMGYKGYIQLAMRTGQYKSLNAGVIYEGIDIEQDLLTGKVTLSGQAKNDHPQGYFAYEELINGFTKTAYMPIQEVLAHAKRYSKSYGKEGSAWVTDFDAMAIKTMLLKLLRQYGVMSVEMVQAFSSDDEDELQQEKAENANKDIIDVPAKVVEDKPAGEVKAGDPGF